MIDTGRGRNQWLKATEAEMNNWVAYKNVYAVPYDVFFKAYFHELIFYLSFCIFL